MLPTDFRPLDGASCLLSYTYTYLVPFVVDALRSDGSIRIGSCQLDAIILGNLLHLSLDGLNGLPLLIGLRESRFELLVCCNQALCRRKESRYRDR